MLQPNFRWKDRLAIIKKTMFVFSEYDEKQKTDHLKRVYISDK